MLTAMKLSGERSSMLSMLPHTTRRRSACMPSGGEHSTALMQQLSSGDTAALGRLYDATVGRVYARALRITGNPADAEEVTCDVYRQVWQNAKQFDPQRGIPLQWLMVIARSRALDCSRKSRAQRQSMHVAASLYENESSPSTDEVLHQCEMAPILRATLLHLSSVQARVIGLAFFDGLSHREIARVAHMPLGTVKSHLCRALLVLRKALTGVGGLDSLLGARHGSRAHGAPMEQGSPVQSRSIPFS
jgi:RNA polymerase sigma-70 factor, ECF subfamily